MWFFLLVSLFLPLVFSYFSLLIFANTCTYVLRHMDEKIGAIVRMKYMTPILIWFAKTCLPHFRVRTFHFHNFHSHSRFHLPFPIHPYSYCCPISLFFFLVEIFVLFFFLFMHEDNRGIVHRSVYPTCLIYMLQCSICYS